MGKRKMSLKDACDLVPDDLPDGAFFAMAHEFAGAEYGDAWDELIDFESSQSTHQKCPKCHKKFGSKQAVLDHHKAKHE